jgi:hypothetical protein
MWFHSLFDALSARSSRTPSRKKRPAPSIRRRSRFFRPRLEILEGRTLLSTYTVDALTDTGSGSGLTGDLRYCITKATSGQDTITFGVTGTIMLQSALPTLNASVAIEGPGASQLAVERSSPSASLFGIFAVGSGATVEISGLTVTHSATTAITNAGTLTVSDCTVSGNTNNTYSNTAGGAFDNSGVLIVNNSNLSGNRDYAQNIDDIYNTGTANVSNSTITAAFSGAGTIYNYGTVTLDDITLTYGVVKNDGTLIVGNSAFSGAFSGAIVNSDGDTATISNCTFWDGGIDNLGRLIVSGSAFQYAPIDNGNSNGNSSSATIDDCTLSDSSAFYNGSASSAIISDSTLVGNTGSAVFNYGNLTINDSTISGNKAVGPDALATGTPSGPYGGGGVYPAGNGIGGGIYMAAGALVINSSTIANNQAVGGNNPNGTDGYGNPSPAGNGYGGGLYIAAGTVSINNSTLAGNFAGGGFSYYSAMDGAGYGGGIYNAAGPSALQMYDTILADNTADTAGPDLSGSLSSLGHNLIGNTSGGTDFAASDLLNVNPKLGPLQNNGGPTQTMALLAGSPAIDAGDNTNAPAYDQRGPGYPRIVNGTIDIGAFEAQNSTSNQASGLTVAGFPSVLAAGSAGSFTVTARNADGTTDTGYTGTVHFTSSDSQATLPADYTFMAGDAGVHTFTATLRTAGTQSITATDTTTPSLTAADGGIAVNPANASVISVAGFPSPSTAGVAGSFAVTLKDAYGNIATGYTGTVLFTSSDAKAALPATYTFTATDAGTHSFGAALKTAGTQSITATDTTTASLTGTDGGITVNAAKASKFILSAPSSVTAGQTFSLTVTVEDAYANVVISYAGTVHFSSTDPKAQLPKNYTFTASDKGVHIFTGLVLHTKGNQKITVTDTNNSALTGSVIVDVLSGTRSRVSKAHGMASSQDEPVSWCDWGLAILPDLDAEDGTHHKQSR